MRKLLFTSILSFLFTVLISQVWCPPGATWNYTITGIYPNIEGYQQVRFIDTIRVNGKLCQKLESTIYEVWTSWGNHVVERASHIITHLENQVLTYQSAPNRFDTIAVFNARPGTHWYAYAYQGTSNTPTNIPQFTVRDTGYALVNGFTLKYLEVGGGDSLTVFTPSNAPYVHRIYERMGDVSQFLYMICPLNELDWRDSNGRFTCYWDNTFPIYSSPGMKCNYNLVGIEEQFHQSRERFFPNPGNGLYQFELQQASTCKVFNTQGVLMFESSDPKTGSEILDLRAFPNGIYFVHLKNESGSSYSKLVKAQN